MSALQKLDRLVWVDLRRSQNGQFQTVAPCISMCREAAVDEAAGAWRSDAAVVRAFVDFLTTVFRAADGFRQVVAPSPVPNDALG